MFTLDGVIIRSRPITLARLCCGCVKTYEGHGIEIDVLASCPEPDTCPGTAQQREYYPSGYSLAAVTAVKSVVNTYVVG